MRQYFREHFTQILIAFVAILVVGGVVFFILNLDNFFGVDVIDGIFNSSAAKNEATKQYIGDGYYIEKDVTVYLLMGLDKFGPQESSGSYNNTAQADFISLLIFNNTNKTYQLLEINRETMANVKKLGINNQPIGKSKMQICISHTYGDGMKTSCINTLEAVQELLFNLRIDYYMSMTMDVVTIMVDKVGGVDVTLDDDYLEIDPSYTNGATIHLDKNNIMDFIRDRSELSDSSNENRMKRQSLVINAIFGNIGNYHLTDSIMLDMYSDISEYTVTNMNAIQFTAINDNISRKDYTFTGTYTPDGESRVGLDFMEFWIDETSLQNLAKELLFAPID